MSFNLLSVIIIGLIFYRISFVNSICDINHEYLSLEVCKSYRGIFSILVVVHHLSHIEGGGIVFKILGIVGGCYAVPFFFFLSGYGLQKSYITKKSAYKKQFLLRRIPTLLIPYIIATTLYWLLYFINGKSYSLKEIFATILKGNPIVTYSWYIISILAFYIFFWLSMNLCKHNNLLMLLCGTIYYIAYTAFCLKMNYGSWWFTSSHLLIVGMFWAIYENKILSFLNKKSSIPNILFFTSFLVIWTIFVLILTFYDNIDKNIHIPYISVFATLLLNLLFVIGVVALTLKVKISNSVLRFLGNVSMEIYIFHGLFISLFRSKILHINNDTLYVITVIVSTIVFSFVIHLFISFFMEKYKKLLGNLSSYHSKNK